MAVIFRRNDIDSVFMWSRRNGVFSENLAADALFHVFKIFQFSCWTDHITFTTIKVYQYAAAFPQKPLTIPKCTTLIKYPVTSHYCVHGKAAEWDLGEMVETSDFW